MIIYKRSKYENFIFGVTYLSVITLSNVFADDILTGDTKLAREAILCLSSGTRPSECAPSLARYFGIHFKKPWKTIEVRKSFSNLCPIQNDANVEDLVLKFDR